MESWPITSIINRVGFPITTTSFNITKQAPIDNEAAAKSLFEQKQKIFGKKMEWIADESCSLSGNASSIVMIDKNVQGFSFLRKGKYAKEIEAFSGLFIK